MSEPPVSSEGELTSFRNRNLQFRKESRYKSPLAAIAYVHADQRPERETVWMANVSSNGLGFLCKAPVPVGTHLVVEMGALAGGRRDLSGVVVHATQQLNGDWLVGCQLDAPLTDDEMEACLNFESPYLSQLKS
jgi:hypothetical protein